GPGQVYRVGKERDSNQVHQRREHATYRRGQQAVEKVDVNVTVGAYRGGDGDEHRADQQVAGNLLGPGSRLVEHVAREELIEDVARQDPEERERDPRLQRVMRKVDRRVDDTHASRRLEDMLCGWRCDVFSHTISFTPDKIIVAPAHLGN